MTCCAVRGQHAATTNCPYLSRIWRRRTRAAAALAAAAAASRQHQRGTTSRQPAALRPAAAWRHHNPLEPAPRAVHRGHERRRSRNSFRCGARAPALDADGTDAARSAGADGGIARPAGRPARPTAAHAGLPPCHPGDNRGAAAGHRALAGGLCYRPEPHGDARAGATRLLHIRPGTRRLDAGRRADRRPPRECRRDVASLAQFAAMAR